jgi:hypothetical protein
MHAEGVARVDTGLGKYLQYKHDTPKHKNSAHKAKRKSIKYSILGNNNFKTLDHGENNEFGKQKLLTL